MRPVVEINHARIVNHLVGDDDFVRALGETNSVAIEHGRDARDTARDTAVVEREVVEAIEWPGAESTDARLRLLARLCFGRQRGPASIGRLDDDRRVTE